MFLRINLTISMLFAVHFVFAQQNLVPNPSFEDTVQCPISSNYDEVVGWFLPNKRSSDFWHRCAGLVPQEILGGYHEPKTGDAYAGIMLCAKPVINDYREYLSIKLKKELEKDIEYEVSFWVALRNNNTGSGAVKDIIATDRIGAFFSKDSIFYEPHGGTNSILDSVPQIQNPIGNFLLDTINWMEIKGRFIAKGGESYINIGNFFRDTVTDTVVLYWDTISTFRERAVYYLIDDVSVIDLTEPPPFELDIPNVFTPNNDGQNDLFTVNVKGAKTIDVKIFNRWGQLLAQWNDFDGYWDGTYRGNPVPEGVYFMQLVVEDLQNNVINKQVPIHLFR